MPQLAEIQEKFQDLIRKGLQGSFFVKRHVEGDPEITALVDAAGLLALPPGYTDVGYLTKDQGLEWTRDVSTSDVESHGAAEPTRRDVVTDVSGLQFTMQESKRQVFELYEGVDLSTVTHDANGNVTWDKPDRPASIYYRGFALFKDGEGVDATYFAKWLPRFGVTDRGSQSWNENDELQYPVTLTAFTDGEVGTSVRNLWAGPTARIERMGFAAATP